MTGMLRWLSREDSYEDALDRLMKVIPLDQRDRTRSKVVTGVAMYDLACCASNADVHQVIEDIRTVSFKVMLLLIQIFHIFCSSFRENSVLLLTQNKKYKTYWKIFLTTAKYFFLLNFCSMNYLSSIFL